MSNTTVIPLRQPATIDDPLTEVLRVGARELLAKAVEAEVEEFLAAHAGLRTADGHQRVVRHGHGPERQVQTGIGPVVVRRAKVRDRGDDETAGERIRFSSAILPKWARRSASLDALLPVLYLRGISTGDFQEALSALLGQDAPNLSARRYVYIWADGIHIQARMEENAQCILVIIGATPEGKKELVGFQIGYRESTQSWRELLVDLQARGLAIAPELATGDGALGFWKALDEVFPGTRHQRCWVHKIANVLNKLPKSVHKNAKADLAEIWNAPDRASAELALNVFAEKYQAKYQPAVTCLTKDRDALFAFFGFPAAHWQHLRTTNPIESVFATVRHRTVRTKGSLSHATALVMVFKLVMAASKTWRRLKGRNHLPKVINGVKFTDGIEATEIKPTQTDA